MHALTEHSMTRQTDFEQAAQRHRPVTRDELASAIHGLRRDQGLRARDIAVLLGVNDADVHAFLNYDQHQRVTP